ncbi:SIMPL domain-containing protein [Myxococcaceae bacterium JPH2]|nr:SIMPL domain-containing protein [Myxococcaceae bacterium JPH2]
MAAVMSLSLSAMAQSQPMSAPLPPPPHADISVRTIRVEGTGEVKAQPDEAYLDLAVETEGANVKVASEENARRMEKVLAALSSAGLTKRDLQTRNYNVYPTYTPPTPDGAEPKVKGYRVSNLVTAHVTDLSKVGSLLDKALTAGANRVDSVRFGLTREEAAQGEALRQAVARARQSAQVLATALNVKLGAVLDASTVTEPQRFFPMNRAYEMTADSRASATPIVPEEQTLQAKVTLVFAIESGR